MYSWRQSLFSRKSFTQRELGVGTRQAYVEPYLYRGISTIRRRLLYLVHEDSPTGILRIYATHTKLSNPALLR